MWRLRREKPPSAVVRIDRSAPLSRARLGAERAGAAAGAVAPSPSRGCHSDEMAAIVRLPRPLLAGRSGGGADRPSRSRRVCDLTRVKCRSLRQVGQLPPMASETGVRAASGGTTVRADEGEDPALRSLVRRQEPWRADHCANAREPADETGSPPDHGAVPVVEIFERGSRDGPNSPASEEGERTPVRGPELRGTKRTDGSINRSDGHAAYERVTTPTTPGTAQRRCRTASS